jgi:hypothetical protein
MVAYYEVFLKGDLVGIFRALSDADAIKQAYMKTGSASLYTGPGLQHYTARKL